MSEDKIVVSKEVFEGLEEVRQSGETNMFNMKRVQKIAYNKKYYATVEWLENVDKTTYAKGIMHGFKLEEE